VYGTQKLAIASLLLLAHSINETIKTKTIAVVMTWIEMERVAAADSDVVLTCRHSDDLDLGALTNAVWSKHDAPLHHDRYV